MEISSLSIDASSSPKVPDHFVIQASAGQGCRIIINRSEDETFRAWANGGVRFFGKSPAKRAKELLTRIANNSGGRAYFPKDIGEIPAIAVQIANHLRTQYAVSYYPANDKRDGSFRAIQVVVNPVGRRKLIAHTRLGYYARNADGQLPATQKRSRDN